MSEFIKLSFKWIHCIAHILYFNEVWKIHKPNEKQRPFIEHLLYSKAMGHVTCVLAEAPEQAEEGGALTAGKGSSSCALIGSLGTN